MKKTLLILLITFNALLGQSNKEIDSLKIVLKHTTNDSLKIEALYKLGKFTLKTDIIQSQLYVKKLRILSTTLKSDLGFARTHNLEGIHYFMSGASEKAFLSFKKALFFSFKAKSFESQAASYNNIALYEYTNSNYLRATYNYIEALKINEKLKRYDEQCINMTNMVYSYLEIDDYINAEKYVLKALSLKPKLKNNEILIKVYLGLGIINRLKKNYNLSINYLRMSCDLLTKLRGMEDGIIYSQIALNYIDLKDFKNAKNYLHKSFLLSKKDESLILPATYNETLTKLFIETKDYEKAKKANNIARINYKKLSNEKGIFTSYQNSIAIAVAQNNYRAAYFYNVKADEIEKKFNTKKIKLAVSELNIKYDTLKKEKLLNESKTEAKFRNILLIFISILVVFLIFSSYLIFRKQALQIKQKIKENELNEALSKIETQDKLHKQRLHISRDLHDNIGSQLSYIASSIDNVKYGFKETNPNLNGKLGNISNFAKDTIVELRDTIWTLNDNDITVEDLETKIRVLLNKTKESHPEINFEIQFDSNLKQKNFKPLQILHTYRCIQEAVNNSLKHAFASKISIISTQIHNSMQIVIEDNGVGFSEVESGNGLFNMQKRMEEIEGQYKILSTNKGTQITILITLIA